MTSNTIAECFAAAKYTKPELRERIKQRVMAGAKGGRAGQWSARKAQIVAQEYERAGGGYRGKRSVTQRSLSRWTKEEWRTRSGKPSVQGDEATGERYLPTAAIKRLSASQYAATSAKKREGLRSGMQFVPNTERAAVVSGKVRRGR